MSDQTTAQETETTAPDDYAWRVTKRPGDSTAQIEIGSMYADFDGPELTLLMHRIGRGLIQVGTLALESRMHDDGDDEDDW